MKRFFIGLLMFLTLGYSLGVSTLIGPARLVSNIAHNLNLNQGTENILGKAVIIGFLLFTLLAVYFLLSLFSRIQEKHLKFLIIIFCLGSALGSFWLMMNPAEINLYESTQEISDNRFTLGPYPTEEILRRLKKQGFTGVISLLHPAVTPFEPRMLDEEKKNAKKIGLELISAPLLPWIGEQANTDSLEIIRKIAKSKGGRYYVHCYLGKDRVRIAKRIIEASSPTAKILSLIAKRSIKNLKRFERGSLIHLDDDVFISPFPTNEEFVGFILNGNIQTVVSILDPNDEADKTWIDKEEKLIKTYHLAYTHFPTEKHNPKPESFLALVKKIRSLPRPILIHAFSIRDPRIRAFIYTYRNNSLPPKELLMEQQAATIKNGRIILLDYNRLLSPILKGEELEQITKKENIKKVFVLPEQKNGEEYDPQKILNLAREIWKMPTPLLVMTSDINSPRSDALIKAFRTDLPPLTALLFQDEMSGGKTSLITPNVAIGPRPSKSEFKDYLYKRGIRKFLYFGNPRSTVANEDSLITHDNGLDYQAINNEKTNIYDILSQGGPWYIYGPALESTKRNLKGRLGPDNPEMVIKYPTAQKVEILDGLAKIRPLISALLKGKPIHSEAIPDLKTIVLFGPLFILFTIFAATLSTWYKTEKNLPTPYTRKIFHFQVFTFACLIRIFAGLPALILFGIIAFAFVIYATIRGNNFPFYETMARPKDAPHRTLFILIPMLMTGAGGIINSLFFGKLTAIGFLISGWGDAIGEPVGNKWGKHRYKVSSLGKVPATRSLEGSFAILIVGILGGFLATLFVGFPLQIAIIVGIVCGIVGALVEAVSNHGLDNLTVQIATCAAAFALIKFLGG